MELRSLNELAVCIYYLLVLIMSCASENLISTYCLHVGIAFSQLCAAENLISTYC